MVCIQYHVIQYSPKAVTEAPRLLLLTSTTMQTARSRLLLPNPTAQRQENWQYYWVYEMNLVD